MVKEPLPLFRQGEVTARFRFPPNQTVNAPWRVAGKQLFGKTIANLTLLRPDSPAPVSTPSVPQ
jgi:hypothetical protein